MGGSYRDRSHAGRALGAVLSDSQAGPAPDLVLALPRGGVPVAVEVARRLGTEFDVLLVRKLGVPGHRELAMGAIASGGIRVVNPDVVAGVGIDRATAEEVMAEEQAELERRALAYRGDRPPPVIACRRVLLVDDGLATGASMAAAVEAARAGGASWVGVAVPVGSAPAVRRLELVADAVISPLVPEPFRAVGWWYDDFAQVSDGSIRSLLGTFSK